MKAIHRSIELSDQIVSDDMAPTRVLIATNDPSYVHGFDISFSDQMLRKILENFNNKVYATRISFNYDHPSSRGAKSEAAAWIHSLDLTERGSGLGLYADDIEWTEKGQKCIMSKEYLYTSVGIYLNYLDPRDGKTEHGPTLFEVTLTNKPADKAIGDIFELSDNIQNCDILKNKEIDMNADELNSKIKQLTDSLAETAKANKELNEKISDLGTRLEKSEKAERETRAKLSVEKRTRKLDNLITQGRITPAMKDKALSLSEEGFKGFELTIPEERVFNDSSKSLENPKGESVQDPSDKITELSEALKKKNPKMTTSEAITKVLSENPELEKEYYKGKGYE